VRIFCQIGINKFHIPEKPIISLYCSQYFYYIFPNKYNLNRKHNHPACSISGCLCRGSSNATELIKKLLFSAKNSCFSRKEVRRKTHFSKKAWFPLRAYSTKFGKAGACQQGGRGETFSKSFLRESGYSGMIIEVTKQIHFLNSVALGAAPCLIFYYISLKRHED
jgi:hypothetical protein